MTLRFRFAGQLGLTAPDDPLFRHLAGSADPIEQIAWLHDNGFAGVTDNRLKHRPPAVQEAMGRELVQRGMRMGTFTHASAWPGQPRALPFTRRDAGAREHLRNEMQASVDAFRRIGSGIALITSLSEPARPVADQMDDFADNLEDLLPMAEKAGLRLAVEGVSPARLGGLVLALSSQAYALAQRVASPSLGIVFDTYHVGTQEGDLAQALRRTADKVFAIQLSDVPDRIAPGLGSLPLAELLREASQVRIDGVLFELEYFPGARNLQAETEAFAALSQLDRRASGEGG